jgi:hypothetical protein
MNHFFFKMHPFDVRECINFINIKEYKSLYVTINPREWNNTEFMSKIFDIDFVKINPLSDTSFDVSLIVYKINNKYCAAYRKKDGSIAFFKLKSLKNIDELSRFIENVGTYYEWKNYKHESMMHNTKMEKTNSFLSSI